MAVTIIDFTDLDSGDEGQFIVRRLPDCVGLTITLNSNGDLAAYVTADVLERLIRSLQTALDEST
jgi:hypothetical protein